MNAAMSLAAWDCIEHSRLSGSAVCRIIVTSEFEAYAFSDKKSINNTRIRGKTYGYAYCCAIRQIALSPDSVSSCTGREVVATVSITRVGLRPTTLA
jgi:hypothetical protein